MVSLIPMGIHSKIITNGPYSNYSTISMSDASLLLLELELTLARMSSKKDKVILAPGAHAKESTNRRSTKPIMSK